MSSSPEPPTPGTHPTRITGAALTALESLLLANVRDAIVVVDVAGTITYWNHGATAIFGWTADEVLGHAFGEFFPDVASSGITAIVRALPHGGMWHGEHLDRRKGGRQVLLKARVQQVFDATGQASGMLGWAQDITEQRATEDALRASEERYRSLLDLAPEAIAIVQHGRCVYANRVAATMMGASSPAELVGRVLNDHLHPDEVSGSLVRQARTLDGTQARALSELRLRHLDGSYTLLETHAGRCEFNGAPAIQIIARDVTERRRSEVALRESEARLAEAQELGGIGSFEVDVASGTATASPALHRIFGFPADAPALDFASFVERFVHPDDREHAVRSRDEAMVPGGVDSIDYRFLHPDGSERVIQMHRRTETGPAGTLGRMLCTVQDVTERTLAEERLRASEQRYRMFVDHASDALFLHDHLGRVLDVNRQACDSLGYTRDELIGQMPYMFDPVITEGVMEQLLTHLDEGTTETIESLHKRKDGTLIPVEIRIRPFTLGHERVALSLARDMTERKTAELALRRSEATLQRAQRIAHIGSWTIEVSTNRFQPSDEMRRMCGLEGDGPWQTSDLFRLLHPDDRERGLQVWRAAIGGEAAEFEHRLIVGNEVRWAYSASTTERDDNGRPVVVAGITQDITARRRLEEQFQQAQKMEAVGKLAGGVAHDFNNMLTVINGYTDLLLSELELYDPRREKLTQVREAGERAAGLTRQLLAFSRKQILAPRLVNLNDIVRRAEVMLRRLIGEDVTVATDLAPDLAQLKADPSQLEQVLLNLAVNARDAMPHGGHLTVATRTITVDRRTPGNGETLDGRYVELSVADTGVGMPPDVCDRVFEPFFTTKPTGTGTGLGLSTVYGIVKQSGGHISVESAVERGSTFRILLPAAPDDATVVVQAVPADGSHRGSETVLVVEDEEAVRRVARISLEMHGYRVIEAAGGDEARRWAANYAGPIHLVLTDVVMAEMSGRDVADLLRALRPNIKILFMSGYTDDAVVRHGVLEATDDFLQKPFTPVSLASKVRAILDA